IIAEIGMPFFMYGLAPGFDAQPEKFDLAVLLTRITMPYLLCMCLVALMSGALNSVGKFAESSSVSIVLNLAMMSATLVSLYLGYNAGPEAGIIQAWGVFAAGVLQLWLLMWGMKRNGLSLKLRRPRWTPDLRKLWQLGVPGIISGGVTQLNIAIGTVIASMQPGAVSHLYYADRIYELPLAIVGIAVGVVLLPAISRSLRSGDHAAVTDSQNRSLEFAMMLTIPAAVAIAIMPAEIVGVLFQRGAFTAQDTATTAAVLGLFALGLPAFVMIKVFSPAFFAREDTKTPMRYATISLTANTLGSIALFYLFRAWGWQPELGIAIATSAGGCAHRAGDPGHGRSALCRPSLRASVYAGRQRRPRSCFHTGRYGGRGTGELRRRYHVDRCPQPRAIQADGAPRWLMARAPPQLVLATVERPGHNPRRI
ncbi:MAG: murein biosynthesis integral membrane protein MurJ, partial [Hyphomonas sp.]|nr:murein biosynthesis integral membrane protein MurJ [Hyphomonas sp.]